MKRRTITVGMAAKRMRKKGLHVTPRHVRRIIVATRYTENALPAEQLTPGGPHRIDAEKFDIWLEKRKVGWS